MGLYRYGFNGKENDNEVKGDGNQQDYGFRIYDPRVGRFLSVDPLAVEYPWYTPYQFAGNKPIRFIDRDGAEEDDPFLYRLFVAPVLKATNDIWIAANFYTISVRDPKTVVDEVASSAAGTVDGLNSRLSLGLLHRTPESLGINEQYSGWYNGGSLVAQIAPIPGAPGNGTVSPSLAVAGESRVVAQAASLELKTSNTVLANASLSSYNYGNPETSPSDKPESSIDAPGRTQSRINITEKSWQHVIDRHYNKATNASKFTISLRQLRTLLTSEEVAKWPITRTLNSSKGLRYVREVIFKSPIGKDKFNNYQPTKTMTILTDGKGNLDTTTPGIIK